MLCKDLWFVWTWAKDSLGSRQHWIGLKRRFSKEPATPDLLIWTPLGTWGVSCTSRVLADCKNSSGPIPMQRRMRGRLTTLPILMKRRIKRRIMAVLTLVKRRIKTFSSKALLTKTLPTLKKDWMKRVILRERIGLMSTAVALTTATGWRLTIAWPWSRTLDVCSWMVSVNSKAALRDEQKLVHARS